MPIYEYECSCCLSRFELKHSFNEDTPVNCPQCGGSTKRIFLPVSIIFKGTGFYVTDSRAKRGQELDESGTKATKANNVEKKDD